MAKFSVPTATRFSSARSSFAERRGDRADRKSRQYGFALGGPDVSAISCTSSRIRAWEEAVPTSMDLGDRATPADKPGLLASVPSRPRLRKTCTSAAELATTGWSPDRLGVTYRDELDRDFGGARSASKSKQPSADGL
jgi:hypothetical protein